MEDKEKEEEVEAEDVKRSVTSRDFNIDDFVPMEPAPTAVRSTLLCWLLIYSYFHHVSILSRDTDAGNLSVCLSNMRCHCVETVEHVIIFFAIW